MKLSHFLLQIFLLFFLFNNNVCFANWDEQIKPYSHLLSANELNIIKKQYDDFQEKKLIKATDERIKQIPIIENSEQLINIATKKNTRIKVRTFPKKNVKQKAGKNKISSGPKQIIKIREGLYTKLEKMVEFIDEISEDFNFNKQQINIVIYDGFRNIKTQSRLFNNKSTEICKENPNFTKIECDDEATLWVSPVENNIPPHSTGGAIDMKLHDSKNKKFLDMGQMGVTQGSNPSAPTFSPDISDEQIKNRLFLLIAATKAGLINYPYEFWHYSYGDRYAAFWLNLPNAFYDSAKE